MSELKPLIDQAIELDSDKVLKELFIETNRQATRIKTLQDQVLKLVDAMYVIERETKIKLDISI